MSKTKYINAQRSTTDEADWSQCSLLHSLKLTNGHSLPLSRMSCNGMVLTSAGRAGGGLCAS